MHRLQEWLLLSKKIVTLTGLGPTVAVCFPRKNGGTQVRRPYGEQLPCAWRLLRGSASLSRPAALRQQLSGFVIQQLVYFSNQQVAVLKQLHRAEPTASIPSAAAACLQQLTSTTSKAVSNPTTMADLPSAFKKPLVLYLAPNAVTEFFARNRNLDNGLS
ncbi:uncharacterized protein LOC126670408 [Mercurialis annua]|uniref:uncharacterized protein LOC126670408 n=1 Tax=Mercurialis annua TaxID=3986 RepID=UPI00215F30C8|nr:uncharacterized protein LOC126670408 [Mercurialis annua]